MAYTKTAWVNGTPPAINATNLNKMETGIDEAHDFLNLPGWDSFPPFLDENLANLANKPSIVTRGLWDGYSLPHYAVGEQLKFRMRVPHIWDGVTAPWFVAITSISNAETIGHKYKFQAEWSSADIGAVIPDTTTETLTDQVVIIDGTQWYAEIIAFELTPTTLVAGQNLQLRLRRIEADATFVISANEIVVWHWDTRWKVNKVATTNPMGYP